MRGDILHPLTHQPHAAPVSEALQIFLSPTYGHVLTSRLIPAVWEHPCSSRVHRYPHSQGGPVCAGCCCLAAQYSFHSRLSTTGFLSVSRPSRPCWPNIT